MAHFYVGDIPAEDVVIEPVRPDGEPFDLSPFTDVDVDLVDPAGVPVPSSGFVGTIQGDLVVVEWPGDTVLSTAGLYAVRVTLIGDPHREQLPTLLIPVEDQSAGWATVDQARDEWPDATQIGDVKLWRLLEISRLQVIDYAPALAAGARPPQNYVEGQLMAARNTWNNGRTSPTGELGDAGFAITPRPLDWHIKQVLRPKRGVPVIW